MILPLYFCGKLKFENMNGKIKGYLITAIIAAGVVIAMDYILPIKVDSDFVGHRFGMTKDE